MRLRSCAILVLLLFGCVGSSGIHRSVGYQNLKEVQEYVEKGGTSCADSMKHTPLILAAYYGSAPIVYYLCEKKADLNAQDVEGRTALIWAAFYGHIEITNFLLKSGADPNLKDVYGYNALGYADKFGREEIAASLKSYGAQPFFAK